MAFQLASPRLRQLQAEVAQSEQRLRNSIPLLSPRRRRPRRHYRSRPLLQRPRPRRRAAHKRRRRRPLHRNGRRRSARNLTAPLLTERSPSRRRRRAQRMLAVDLTPNI